MGGVYTGVCGLDVDGVYVGFGGVYTGVADFAACDCVPWKTDVPH